MDESPLPYISAFLGFTVFASDLGIKTIRVDTVEPPTFFGPDFHRMRVEAPHTGVPLAWGRRLKLRRIPW